jgi:hypothetical protein
MPNSLTVSSRHRLPPAIAAGRAGGQNDIAHDPPWPSAEKTRDLDLALIDKRERRKQRAQHERRIDRDFREDNPQAE